MRQYTIKKVTGDIDWANVPALDVDNYLWCEPLDIKMKSQICYSEEGLHVHLRAWEKDIRAELTEPMSMVCEDSCMEFFFRPMEGDLRYFNLEINPNGQMYIGFGPNMPKLVRLALQEEELLSAEKMEDYRIMGELLTAQLHLVPRGADKVQLNNYYDGQMLEVPLDVRLTPAQNAQRYFKRYQKARAAVRLAAEQKEKTLRELEILESALCDLDTSETEDDLSDVRRVLQDAGLMKKDSQNKKKQTKNQRQSAPMRFEAEDGTAITVGKNSLQNERLTQSARGDEIWLHAKDMPGSHVIIHNEGKPVSDATLLTAANLAAWFSKGKGLSVPVDMTLKKYVKKPAGTPTGFVTYTHQKTYRITVSEADIRAIKQLKNK